MSIWHWTLPIVVFAVLYGERHRILELTTRPFRNVIEGVLKEPENVPPLWHDPLFLKAAVLLLLTLITMLVV